MRIKLATPLIGEFPRYANVKLPDNAAVTAQNMCQRWGKEAEAPYGWKYTYCPSHKDEKGCENF